MLKAVTAGKTVRHKTFGEGRIVAVEARRFTIDFDGVGTKDLGINLSLVNGLLVVDGLELSEEQMVLLRDESKIHNAVSYTEKAFIAYVEYLDWWTASLNYELNDIGISGNYNALGFCKAVKEGVYHG